MHTNTSPSSDTQHGEPPQSVGKPLPLCLLFFTEDTISEAGLQLLSPQHHSPSGAPRLVARSPTKTPQPPALSSPAMHPPPALTCWPRAAPLQRCQLPLVTLLPGQMAVALGGQVLQATSTGSTLSPCTPLTSSIPQGPAQTPPHHMHSMREHPAEHEPPAALQIQNICVQRGVMGALN